VTDNGQAPLKYIETLTAFRPVLCPQQALITDAKPLLWYDCLHSKTRERFEAALHETVEKDAAMPPPPPPPPPPLDEKSLAAEEMASVMEEAQRQSSMDEKARPAPSETEEAPASPPAAASPASAPLAPAPSAAAPPAAAPPAAPPSAVPPSAAPPPAAQTFEITVPESLSAGQLLQASINGTTVRVTVPANLPPSRKMRVALPAQPPQPPAAQPPAQQYRIKIPPGVSSGMKIQVA